jgi:hypothetical protein
MDFFKAVGVPIGLNSCRCAVTTNVNGILDVVTEGGGRIVSYCIPVQSEV